jgi:diaminohydroxyphosphoribosylaminopyrimidine deaminase/5-amino-6-(5-phosphoribosylamino)uracil reductase
MQADERYMRAALALAAKARGLTSPNPAVGAVVVRRGRVVGSGYHRRCGLPHAEAVALRRAGRLARGATLYVTLEPCGHFGRTPPCTGAIIESGVRRVVVAMKDPNPITDGRGIRKLMRRGIKVEVGLLSKEAQALNAPFVKSVTARMPFVTLKSAVSLDGKIAARTGDSKWITAPDARRYVRRLRARTDAVVTGVDTVIADDPELLARPMKLRQPARVIVDSRLRTPAGSRILGTVSSSPVMIFTTSGAPAAKRRMLAARGATVIAVKPKKGRVDLAEMMRRLCGMGIIDVFAECGGELAAGLIEEGLVDRFLFFVAPKIVGGRTAPTAVGGAGAGAVKDSLELGSFRIKRFARDVLIEASKGS